MGAFHVNGYCQQVLDKCKDWTFLKGNKQLPGHGYYSVIPMES